MNNDQLLRKIYYDPKSEGSFGGVARLRRALKAMGKEVPVKTVKQWLSGEEAYTLFRPVRRKFPRNVVRVSGPFNTISSDLIDVSSLSQWNDNVKFLLTIIDVFSKQAQVVPLMNKNAISVSTALREVFSKLPKVTYFWSDKGTEYRNSRVAKVMQEFGIKQYNTENPEIKATCSERYVRTMRSLIARYLHANNTNRYLDALPDLVSSYNNSYHRSIKMKPNEVNEQTKGRVFVNLYGAGDLVKDQPVRMSKTKGIFSKGSDPSWTTEIVYVTSKNKKHPIHTYKVRDYANAPIIGTFYRQELQPVIPPETYKVEKVLKTRRVGGRTQYYVKWLHYDNSHNSWTDSLTDI